MHKASTVTRDDIPAPPMPRWYHVLAAASMSGRGIAQSVGHGPITVSSECATFNCFASSHISGHDITCDTGMTQAECASQCCSQAECLGFDFSAADSGRCCTQGG